jgi:hypothetical protein
MPKAKDGYYICDIAGCDKKFKRVGRTRYCPKHRWDRNSPQAIAQRNHLAVARYWRDPEAARAKANAIYARTKDDPEKRATIRARDRARYAKDPQKFRDKNKAAREKDPQKFRDRGNTWNKNHRPEINAHVREVYGRDPKAARAYAKANRTKVKAKHPRRWKTLRKAREKRHDEKVRRERGW